MTISEFSSEFDILYNNISSNSAPSIDEYEKSVYLTKAQLEIIKEYNGVLNKYGKSFEKSEKRRVDLKELLVDYKTEETITNDENIDSELNSFFFVIPDNVFLIKFERAFFKFPDCEKEDDIDRRIDVVPVTHDEYNEKVDNPFRKPFLEEAWRLDYSSITVGEKTSKVVELVSSETLFKYQLRYIKYPNPIILSNLANFYGDGITLTIDGESTAMTSELNQEIHQEILDRAVELAVRDYRDGSLQSKVQLNTRNN